MRRTFLKSIASSVAVLAAIGSAAAQAPYLVRDLNQRAEFSGSSPSNAVEVVPGVAVFPAWTAEYGRELWRTDGTRNGTWLLKNIAPGAHSSFQPTGSGANAIARASRGGVFIAADDLFTRRLWRTDGTTQGTIPLYPQLVPAWAPLLSLGQDVLFIASCESALTAQLFATDGSPGPARRVSDLNGRYDSANGLYPLGASDGFAYYSVNRGWPGTLDIWRTDGTSQGTILVADAVLSDYSNPPSFSGSHALWTTTDDNAGESRVRLWSGDGATQPCFLKGPAQTTHTTRPFITSQTSVAQPSSFSVPTMHRSSGPRMERPTERGPSPLPAVSLDVRSA